MTTHNGLEIFSTLQELIHPQRTALLIYDMQAISQRALKRGFITPSGLGIEIPTKQTRKAVDQVRIVPRLDGYVVEVVYHKTETQAAVDSTQVAALDLGVNTLAACTSTKPGFLPLLINGRPLKSLNQTNLPVQPTQLIGRERELGEVLELLRLSRLLTLTTLVKLTGPMTDPFFWYKAT